MSDPQTEHDIAFPRLTEHQIAALKRIATPSRLRDGEALFRAGARRGGFYVVVSGALEIIDDSDKEPRVVAVHEPGEFTGDIDILRRRRPVVSAVARGNTELLEVPPQDIRRIIGEQPELGEVILRAFVARREALIASGFQGVRVIGSGHSRDAYRIREFLTRNQVPATWIDTDDDPGVAELVQSLGLDEQALPAVVCEGHRLLRNPSTRELAEAIGLKRPIGRTIYELVIVGAGPAGLGAAVYAASEGLRTLVLESVAPGGQAGASTRIENYLGFPMGITGADLTGRATLQAHKFGTHFSTPSRVIALEAGGSHVTLRLDDGDAATARCVLIATGADYRRLDVPGSERLEGLGVHYAATPMELATYAERDVVIVGSGNSAGQAAMFLAPHARRVLVVVRGGDLRARMSSYLVERIEASDAIEVLYHTTISRMDGEDRLERVEIENARTGEHRTIETPAVFTFIGAVPRTGWLPPQIESDARGFVRTGRALATSSRWSGTRDPFLLETSHPGVFAAGDVRADSVKRVASAVGEGAMAVKFVHEYLAGSRP